MGQNSIFSFYLAYFCTLRKHTSFSGSINICNELKIPRLILSLLSNLVSKIIIRHQREDGVWDEPFHTGTGFPRVFYLRYHGYSKYFPIWALGMYRNVKMTGESKADQLRKTVQASRLQRKLK